MIGERIIIVWCCSAVLLPKVLIIYSVTITTVTYLGKVILGARRLQKEESYQKGGKYVVVGNRGGTMPMASPDGSTQTISKGMEDIPRDRDAVVDDFGAQQPWFQGSRDPDALEDELSAMPTGCFFIRESHETPNDFILAHLVDLVIHNWLVVVDENNLVGLRRSRNRYSCLTDMVRALCSPQQQDLPIPLRLMRRVRRPRNVQQTPPQRPAQQRVRVQKPVRVPVQQAQPQKGSWRTLATFDMDMEDEEIERRNYQRNIARQREQEERAMRNRIHELELEMDRMRRAAFQPPPPQPQQPQPQPLYRNQQRGRPMLKFIYPQQNGQRGGMR